MRKLKIASLVTLLLVLLSIPTFARDTSTKFSTVKGMYEHQTLQIPSGSDIEGYSYLGILVSRYDATTSNSKVPSDYKTSGAYTCLVEVDGNYAFFIPYSQATGNEGSKVYNLNYDNASVHRALFSSAPELEDEEVSYNVIREESRVFSLEWYHLYRTPEGKIIAVGRDFAQYGNPYRTFFKVGPQTTGIATAKGTYDDKTKITLKIIFSEPVNIKGKISVKFANYPKLIELPTTFNKTNVSAVEDTIILPSDFPETIRTYDVTQNNLTTASVKTEYIMFSNGSGSSKSIRSTITDLSPDGYANTSFNTTSSVKLVPDVQIGDTYYNSFIFDMSKPTISLVNMALNTDKGVNLPNQDFDSAGNAVIPRWFNGNLISVLGKYTDKGSGPARLSILNSSNVVIKTGVIPNANITNNKTKPPYDIAQKATVENQRAVLNLSAREIRNSITSHTLFEGEVVLKAKVEDMAYDSPATYHSEVQTFRTYIDLYPPELMGAVIQSTGNKKITIESSNSKIKKIDLIVMNSKAYKASLRLGMWDKVPEFYLYKDGYNHGDDSIEAFVNHLTGGMSGFANSTFVTKKITLTTPSFEFDEVITDLGTTTHQWLAYRTEDELGNVGYGHCKMDVTLRGAPYLTEIDTPEVDQYFSNLAETNNSVIKLKARTIDKSLAEPIDETDTDNIKEVVVKFNLYKASEPNVPIAGIENIELGKIKLNGPQWTEFNYSIDLKKYITKATDLDGSLILEVWTAYEEDDTIASVPARVPINVYSVKPTLTYTTSTKVVAGTPLPTLNVSSVATSNIPLYGVYNNIGTSATKPPFVFASANANTDWSKIESKHTQTLENLNGTIYYRVLVYDKAQNSTMIQIGPIDMYSDLQSYIYSTKQTSFVGNKTTTSTPTLILSDSIDNTLTHVTSLNSTVQLPLLNLNVKVTDTSTSRVMNSGNSTSTTLELPFAVRNSKLDYKKYLADYTLSSGLDVNAPIKNRVSEVYTIINPIQTLFDITLDNSNSKLTATVKLKSNLNKLTFSNNRTLSDIVTNSKALFGVDLKSELWINVGAPIGDASAKKITLNTPVSIPMSSTDYIAIGYRGKNDSPDYELRFYWDNDLAFGEITNVPSTLVQANSSYEIQVRATHLGESYTLPANMPQSFLDEFKVNIMIIPTTDGTVNYSASAKDNWNNLKGTYAKDYTVEANRKVAKNGKYDILIEVVTPFKIKCYDYKQLNLLLVDKEDYLASENNQSLLLSSTTMFNNLSKKLVNHTIKVTKASDVGAYQLQNGDILVFSKLSQSNKNTVLEVYDSNFNLVKKLDSTVLGSISRINDVLQVKNLILLGTNAGLFSLNNDYTALSQKAMTGSTLASTEIYQLESMNDSVLLGVNNTQTLVMANLVNDELVYNSSKTALDLFTDANKRVRKLQVRNSSIYVTYDTSTNDAVKYTVLE